MSPLQLELAGEAATTAFAAVLAQALAPLPGAVLYLRGNLGMGKTTLARGLLRALGVRGSIRSPTYTLVEPYDLPPRPVLHMDLYRLQAPELDQLGLDDYPPEESLWLVEWPERAEGRLPPPLLDLELLPHAAGRLLRLHAGQGSAPVLARLAPDFT